MSVYECVYTYICISQAEAGMWPTADLSGTCRLANYSKYKIQLLPAFDPSSACSLILNLHLYSPYTLCKPIYTAVVSSLTLCLLPHCRQQACPLSSSHTVISVCVKTALAWILWLLFQTHIILQSSCPSLALKTNYDNNVPSPNPL